MANAKTIGDRLRRLRGDLTQEQVARDLGISQSAITMYETGQRIPRDEIKMLFAQYYNVTVESIFFAKE